MTDILSRCNSETTGRYLQHKKSDYFLYFLFRWSCQLWCVQVMILVQRNHVSCTPALYKFCFLRCCRVEWETHLLPSCITYWFQNVLGAKCWIFLIFRWWCRCKVCSIKIKNQLESKHLMNMAPMQSNLRTHYKRKNKQVQISSKQIQIQIHRGLQAVQTTHIHVVVTENILSTYWITQFMSGIWRKKNKYLNLFWVVTIFVFQHRTNI